MATLLDLFKGSPQDLAVQPDTETFLEQETTGLRPKSGVELNNPLIYGNEAGRIMLRSTPTLETMRESTTGESAGGGLIGKGLFKLTGGRVDSLSDVRNIINDKLGIPEPLIPTRIANKLKADKNLTVEDIMNQKNGTEFGKFLKQTGGGSPKTIVNQAIGNAITLGKDKLRTVLFGKPLSINDIAGISVGDTTSYNSNNIYTDVQKELKYNEAKTKDDILLEAWDTKKINLATVSPIYGVDRKSDLWNSELGQRLQKMGEVSNAGLAEYSPDNKYRNFDDKSNPSPIASKDLETRYGLSHVEDKINLTREGDDSYSFEAAEKLDLVPFWIGKVGAPKKTHFRTLISGLSETVSPSWNTNNFFGNPFPFFTYSSIERNVTFSLQIYCSNPRELMINWEKVNTLSSYAYPTIVNVDSSRQVNPPIIDFRIGDIYKNKIGFVDSLSYTFPENGTWETDSEIGLLPKFIEVSISIKFIENTEISTNQQFYNYKLSEEALKTLNEQNNSSNFSTEPAIQSNGKRNEISVNKLDKYGSTVNFNKAPSSPSNFNKTKSPTPVQEQENSQPTVITAPSIPNETVATPQQLNQIQELVWNSTLKIKGYEFDSKGTTKYNDPGLVVFKRKYDGPKFEYIVLNTDGSVKESFISSSF
jgi:hypothetical protein